MFGFFKKKIHLRDCIPAGYVDIHSHTLCGIDDGAQNIQDTKFLLNAMQDLGFGKVITTPHTITDIHPNTTQIIQATHEKVVRELPKETQQLSYHAASEYMLDDQFEARVKADDLLTLKDKFVLVEMSYINPPIFLDDVLFLLVSKGYTPVMAHPERYNFYKGEKSAFEHLKRMGCKLQLNLLSTVGYYGESVAKTANMLLKEGMYDFSGSDMHHGKHVNAFDNPLVIKETDKLKDLLKKNEFFR